MDVIPVIDIKSGEVVHAQGGRRDSYRPIRTPLSATSAPADVAAGLLRLAPFRQLYIADLDAIEGRGANDAAIEAIARAAPGVELWIDNGIADADAARAWLGGCAHCLVIGSESQHGVETIQSLRDERRVLLSLDFRGEAFQGPAGLLDDAALLARAGDRDDSGARWRGGRARHGPRGRHRGARAGTGNHRRRRRAQ